MIVAYVPEGGSLRPYPLTAGESVPEGAIWVDLLSPTAADDAIVTAFAQIDVPTREEMREIEQSSRLYTEAGARYMTASLLCGADTAAPTVHAVTFILAPPHLITVRYGEPRAFPMVAGRLAKACPFAVTAERLLIELLEAIVDRAADVLEQIGADVEALSKAVFDGGPENNNSSSRYRGMLAQIGRKEGLLSALRESLASLQRLLSFLSAEADGHAVNKDSRASIKSMIRDVSGLGDFAAFIGDKLQFLLDAIIGMVGLEQNNIIKIFAVLSVVLMPPTLIASIYGMNFTHMPELNLTYAYPAAIVAMVISGILPYVIFKWRGWL